MSYRVKRIDPYWIKNPVLPVVAIVGVAAALVLIGRGMVAPAIASAAVGGIAILVATQPAVTAVLATLGLLGGMTTFLLVPNAENAAMSLPLRLLSMLLFTLFYAVLMDGVFLLVAALYNLFAGALGLGGLSLDLEGDGGEDEA
jgi:hypothetical protein